MTIVEMTDEDARLFLMFRQHQSRFKLLLEGGVFDIKSGQATISFKPTGEIGSIVVQALVYRA